MSNKLITVDTLSYFKTKLESVFAKPADIDAKIKSTPATSDTIGAVKPDNDTITIDTDGTIHGKNGGASSWNDLTGKPFNSIGTGLSVDSENKLNANISGVIPVDPESTEGLNIWITTV